MVNRRKKAVIISLLVLVTSMGVITAMTFWYLKLRQLRLSMPDITLPPEDDDELPPGPPEEDDWLDPIVNDTRFLPTPGAINFGMNLGGITDWGREFSFLYFFNFSW